MKNNPSYFEMSFENEQEELNFISRRIQPLNRKIKWAELKGENPVELKKELAIIQDRLDQIIEA